MDTPYTNRFEDNLWAFAYSILFSHKAQMY